ncbi:hypothetical protein GCM10023149_15070 [Mucilaginibacter gynuensis]|uniref:Uncharacterized protein n=1 Tax=Mucilaginibacter gynuensis TaxID=1302236 RepID=A0ABP8G510_9SPHI
MKVLNLYIFAKTIMSNTAIYTVLTLLKVVIIITGMVYVILNIISWRKTKDNKKLKRALVIFGMIFLSILILTIIELVIAFN